MHILRHNLAHLRSVAVGSYSDEVDLVSSPLSLVVVSHARRISSWIGFCCSYSGWQCYIKRCMFCTWNSISVLRSLDELRTATSPPIPPAATAATVRTCGASTRALRYPEYVPLLLIERRCSVDRLDPRDGTSGRHVDGGRDAANRDEMRSSVLTGRPDLVVSDVEWYVIAR